MVRTKFDWIDFIKKVAIIAVPVALQNLLTTTGTMVDTMMIAPLGETSVAAVGLCAQFANLMFSCYWGFVGGGMLFFAQYWGAKDHNGISRAYGTTIFFLLTVASIFTVTSLVAPEFVMQIFTDKVSIQKIGVEYLRIACLSYPFLIFSVGMGALLRSTERVKIPLYASIASVATNIILNWIFIFGKLGLKPMGVRGAALATVCAAFVNALMTLVLGKFAKYEYLFTFKKHFHWTKEWIGEYLKKCFPIICNELFVGIGFTVSNIVLGRQPEEAIAALAVFRTIEGLIIGFFAGFSNAASVLVGKCIGAGDIKTAYSRATRLVLLCATVIFSVCALILVFHTPLLHIMSLSGKSFDYATKMLMVYSVAALIRMCNWMQNDTYRTGGDTAFGTIMEIVFMYVMVIPAVCLTGLVFKLPTMIVFACAYIDEPIRFVIMQKHMYSAKWIKPVTRQGKEAVKKFMEERESV